MKRLYEFCYLILYPFVFLLHPHRIIGREHIPAGAAVVCANHSSNFDPVLLAFALSREHWLHFMAKAELFRVPVLGFILKKIGMFPVERGKGDVAAIKAAMKYLKSGGKIGMFPEGTRVSEAEAGEAKSGAVRLAARTRVPILPVYVPRKKPLFKKVDLIIGAPYMVELDKKTASLSDYRRCAGQLMERIDGLRRDGP